MTADNQAGAGEDAALRFDEAGEPAPRPRVPAVDAILGRPIRLLDHGFVRLVDYMGDDAAIVQAARVSYGPGTRKVSEDRALIRYLLRQRHTSPFEMIEVKLHVKAPIFVARQWLRHRTSCLAGDAVLSFDLSGAARRGRRRHQGVTIEEFHRLWHEGAQHAAPPRQPLFAERVAPERRSTIPEPARLVECREETLRKLVRAGKVRAERRDRQTPLDPALFVWGRAWHDYAGGTSEGQAPPRDRLRKLRLRMCDEATGEIRHTHVTDIWRSGVKPVFKVTLENGATLKMTKDHRCLTARGWLTLEQATRLRLRPDGGVTWCEGAPAFAVNGVPAYQGAEWLAARTARSRPAGKRRPTSARLFRHWANLARIEYAGEEMTYDLAVAGPYHNFVANGMIVHNSVNELSGRYSILPDELYLPDDTQISFQSADNKQGRSAAAVDPALRARVRELLLAGQRQAYAVYQELLDAEIARELARIALPVAVYTEWYWKINLHNLFHFLELRLDPHAQFEIRRYAEAICLIARRLAPVAYAAFEDYARDAVRLSGPERDIVARALRGEPPRPEDWRRLGKRERAEFARKFGLDPETLPGGVAPPVGAAALPE